MNRSGHHAFLLGTVFFSQNRIQKVQNTTLVCEIHVVRGYNPSRNPPAAIRRQPPAERHKVLDVTLHFVHALSFSGRDRIEKMDSHAPTKNAVF